HELRDELFFRKFTPDIHSGRARGCDPQLSFFFLSVVREAVDQAEFLEHSQGDGSQDAEIGQHCKHAAHAQTGACSGADSHAGPDGLNRDAIKHLDIDRIHAVVSEGGKLVGHPQMFEITVRIDLDGLVRLHEGAADGVFQATPDPPLLFDACHALSSIGGSPASELLYVGTCCAFL